MKKTEEKDRTGKPVIRGPLPEKDKITLCELVTWRAIGKAWPAHRLKGLMKRNRGQRRPAFLWDSFEREAANVVSLCCKSDLSPYGSVDGGPHQPFSEGYFLSDVYADPVSDSIGPDPLAWPSSGPYPDELDEEPRELPTYRSVRFLRSDILSISGQADQPADETETPFDLVNLTGAERAAAMPTKARDDNAAAPQKTKKEQKVLRSPVGRKPGQAPFARSDKLLVKEMHKLVGDDEEETSVSSAARQFAPKAKGGGTLESKVDRLRKRYREEHPLKEL